MARGNKKGGQKGGQKNNQKILKTQKKKGDVDSGHASPVESLTQLSRYEPDSRDWVNDVIDFYRDEALKAWKMYTAATLERYTFFLRSKKLELEASKGCEVVQLPWGTEEDMPQEEKDHIAKQFEDDRKNKIAMIKVEEKHAAGRFLLAYNTVNASFGVNDAIPIDPRAPVSYFEDMLKQIAPDSPRGNEKPDPLSLSSSMNSEDSGCVVSSRRQSSKKKNSAVSMNREELLLLRGTMKPIPYSRPYKAKPTAVKSTHKKVSSVMTQYNAKDFGSKRTKNNSTQTDPPVTSVADGSESCGTPRVSAKENPPDHGKALADGMTTDEAGDVDKSGAVEDDAASSNGGLLNGNTDAIGRYKGGGGGKSTNKEASKREIDRAQQIEDDEEFARELARTWGVQQTQSKNPVPITPVKSGQGTRGRPQTEKSSVPAVVTSHSATSAGTLDVFSDSDVESRVSDTTNSSSICYNTKPPSRKFSESSHLNKTSICWNFEKNGECPWGKECIYAHGQKELRPLPYWFQKGNAGAGGKSKVTVAANGHPEPCGLQQCPGQLQFLLRKTSICKMQLAGRCHYLKEECKYAHGQSDLRPLPKHELCKRNLAGKCSLKSSECVYAHSKGEIRPCIPSTVATAKPMAKKSSTITWANPAEGDGFQTFCSDLELQRMLDWGPNTGDCVICAEQFQPKNDRFALNCGHSCFHSGCIRQWLDRDATCPMCRKAVHVTGMFKAPLGGRSADYPPLA